ncbi:AB hydrolase superfamily protein B1A11.02 [Trametes pubescens]|uniref:AB hydrolase superfamily protein B1A11.02 n=1 Tax=Trametes pubescens TaxID=154538 RepID=A0A1M2VA37_TRAPU|nr:AB hydrolase superfamily protein B1A11.02 [Trametes pubescens]
MPQAFDPELAALMPPPLPPSERPAHRLTIAETRAHFDRHVAGPSRAYLEPLLPAESTYTLQDETMVVVGGEIIVRTVVPVVEDEGETFPVLVNIHGGGWSVGSIGLDDYFLRKLSVDLKLTTVNVEYRLAPEHPFPTAVDDCLAALKWVVQNTLLLKADLTKGFLVGGQSAGANIAAVLAHETQDDPFFAGPGRQLTGQVIREPCVIHPDAYPEELKPSMLSMEENKDMPPLPRSVIELLISYYNPPPTDPRFSPLLYPSHAGVAPAFVQGMELDPLRDDARAYAAALEAAGVAVRYLEYPGVSQGFHYIYPAITIAVKVRAELVQGIQWLLGKKSGSVA